MPDHTDPAEPVLANREPATVAEAVRVIVVALVALGWVTVDVDLVMSVMTAVGVLASFGLTWWTRRRVTPLAKVPADSPSE